MTNEKEFSVHVTGETTGETFSGKFKAKERLSHRDKLVRDERRRVVLGAKSEEAPVWAQKYAEVFSQLEVRLVETPSWWRENGNGFDLEDDNVIVEVYNRSLKVEEEFLERRRVETEKAKAEVEKLVAEPK